MSAALTEVLTGWVSCATTGREELVGVSDEQRGQLASGSMPCPSCETTCRPRFRAERMRTDVRVMSWRDGRWQPGFVLG